MIGIIIAIVGVILLFANISFKSENALIGLILGVILVIVGCCNINISSTVDKPNEDDAKEFYEFYEGYEKARDDYLK